MDGEQQKKHRIGWFAIFVLVFLALICDLLGLIPFVKDFLGTIFWICASIYFWKIGMGLFNGRKLAAMAISWIASLIPVVQEIPFELVAGIIAVIIITRIEEKTGLSITPGIVTGNLPGQQTPQITHFNKNGSRGPLNNRIPLNQNGVRTPQATTPPKLRSASIDSVRAPDGGHEQAMANIKRSREIDIEMAKYRQERLGLNDNQLPIT